MVPLSTITVDEALLEARLLTTDDELLAGVDDAGVLLGAVDDLLLAGTEDAALLEAGTEELPAAPILPTPTFAITIAGTSLAASICTL